MAGVLALAAGVDFPRQRIRTIVLDWTATAGGAVSESITDLDDFSGGRIIGFETAPGALGDLATNLPTAAYDITITDSYGADIAAGALVDRSGTVAERVNPSNPIQTWSPLTLVVANAGNATQGRLLIIVEENRVHA